MVGNVRQGAGDVTLADLYLPMLQTPTRFAFVLVRTAGGPANWLTQVRPVVREIDPELAIDRARPLQPASTTSPRARASSRRCSVASPRSRRCSALVGVYGVIAYAVRQREREIAVRLAIGADPARITRLFVRQGAVILLAGLALGVAGAIAAGRALESQLFGRARGRSADARDGRGWFRHRRVPSRGGRPVAPPRPNPRPH